MASDKRSDYILRIRRGRVIRVHKQVLLWRARRKKALKAAKEAQAEARRLRNFFTDEN